MSEFIIENTMDRVTIKNSESEKEFLDIIFDTDGQNNYFDLTLESAKELVLFLNNKINKAECQK